MTAELATISAPSSGVPDAVSQQQEQTAGIAVRKKSVVVRALRWTGTNHEDVRAFVPGHVLGTGPTRDNPALLLATPEGTMLARVDDWIVRGVRGEFYPVRDDIFRETYELPVESSRVSRPSEPMEEAVPTNSKLVLPENLRPSKPVSVAHMAGIHVSIGGRCVQRCAWCGAILVDATPPRILGPDGEKPVVEVYPPGTHVRIVVHPDGRVELDPFEDRTLPPDSCHRLSHV
jgi:hypothetical protein